MQSDMPDVPVIEHIPWYKRRWAAWAGIAATIVVLLAAIVSLIVLAVWNASPEKALLDAADYALKKPGTYQVRSGTGIDAIMRTDGSLYAVDGTLRGVPVSAVLDDATLYVKSADPKRLYDMFVGPSASKTATALFGSILPNLKNQWISFSLQNSSDSAAFLNNIRCFADTRDIMVANDGRSRQQIQDTYLAHPFVTVTAKGGSRYQLVVDSKKSAAFQKAFSGTNASNALDSCGQIMILLSGEKIAGATMTVTLSESRHILQTLSYGNKAAGAIEIAADYSKVDPITIPSNSIDISQIVGSLIESLFNKRAAQ